MKIDSYTKLLLKGNGTNGSTSIIDYSRIGNTVTNPNSMTNSTTQSMYNGTSLYFNGSTTYLNIPISSNFQFATATFTADLWFYYLGSGSQNAFISYSADYAFQMEINQTANTGCVGIRVSSTGGSFDQAAGTYGTSACGTRALTTGWHHIALVRVGTNWKTYIDGNQDVNLTVASATIYAPPTNPFQIGRIRANTTITTGYMDNIHISKDIARWTSNFTPPTNWTRGKLYATI
jgi:hypothetical protein